MQCGFQGGEELVRIWIVSAMFSFRLSKNAHLRPLGSSFCTAMDVALAQRLCRGYEMLAGLREQAPELAAEAAQEFFRNRSCARSHHWSGWLE